MAGHKRGAITWRWRASCTSISWFHSGECGWMPRSARPAYSFNVESYKPSSTMDRYDVVGSRNSESRRRASAISARFNSSKSLRKCTSMKSPLWPMSEYIALCSMALNVAAASASTASRSAGVRAFQAVQRNRIIWCKTLAPSRVSGTAGREVMAISFWHRADWCAACLIGRWKHA